jgi:hypothetical protein
MTLVHVTTHGLRPGDVVLVDQMRLVIDRPIKTSTAHPQNEHSPTLYTPALCLNVDEVTDAYLRQCLREDGDRWTVQGNGLARWTVERTTSSTE